MVEIGMLVVETVVRIRREHAAGKPIKAIARDLKLSRKVVRKAVGAPREPLLGLALNTATDRIAFIQPDAANRYRLFTCGWTAPV